ncbi:MarR family winged helix-turn-helix transcriptional regulator [Sanguibacter sp. HDW7]|uniref:MarR family winged helix-turn-helix transcriptional regulator n=1 Tax=Sanguibacter sp. HDW7 TaxID=2714931 RepID=UPI00140D1759|nr:MarR family transcriptional regulator [Sanguibacter sp. HDW7]QIK84072.1 MarR family transcriptional regulator [Sanguibacter sp. HDW7]
MLPDVDLESQPLKPCAAVDDPFSSDLTWLMHRALKVLSDDFDAACRDNGLRDMRDTLVLATAADGTPRTQIEIANTLGLDKSTLMSIVDRLENEGLMVREADPSNRRIRIPRTTPEGQAVLDRALAGRDKAVSTTLATFQPDDVTALRTLLWQIATAQ